MGFGGIRLGSKFLLIDSFRIRLGSARFGWGVDLCVDLCRGRDLDEDRDACIGVALPDAFSSGQLGRLDRDRVT
jgi:hypothetical protein